MKSTRGQRALRAHKRRKAQEMFWASQPDPIRLKTKGQVKAKGRAQAREFRDMDFKSGCPITVESGPLGKLNSAGTAVVTPRVLHLRSGKTWCHRHPGSAYRAG